MIIGRRPCAPREYRPRFRPLLLVVFSNHDFCLIAVSPGRFSSRPRARHARTGCKRAGWRSWSPSNRSPILQFVRQRRAPSRFLRWLLDVARSAPAGGSMISHAPASAAFPVLPLALAMISSNLRVQLVSLVGSPPLFPPRFLSADVPAVAMPPVAGIADVKHQPAVRPAASQLP